MVNSVDLQEVDSFIVDSKSDICYPHVLIEGIDTEEEVNYFHKKFCNKDRSVPLYIRFNTLYKCIGSFELTLDNLLIVRSIGNYKVSLLVSADKSVDIDLNNPISLFNFITLC